MYIDTRSRFLLVLCLLVLLFCGLATAQGQSLTPQSTATVQPSPPITPTERAALQTLKLWLDQSVMMSETSNSNWLSQGQMQTEADRQRQIEQRQSAQDLSAAQATADHLLTFSEKLMPMLGDFSGSEDQKEAAALVALAKIKADAMGLELENSMLKVTAGIALVAVAAFGTYKLGHHLKVW